MTNPLPAILCVVLIVLSASANSQNFGIHNVGGHAILKTISQIRSAEASMPGRDITAENEEMESGVRPQNPNAPRISSYGTQVPNQPSSVLGVNLSSHCNFLASDIFEGPGLRPPDCNGDISTASQIMLAVNGRLKVYNVPGVTAPALTTPQTSSSIPLASPVISLDMDAFFKNTSLGIAFVTDPHVRFDRGSGRWFIIAQDKSHTFKNFITIAVSNTTVISSSTVFSFYYLQSSTGSSDASNDYFDYPTFGIDKFALYIGGNIFDRVTHATNKGSSLYLIDKSALLSGTLSATIWPYGLGASNSGSVGGTTMVGMLTPQAVHNDDPNATEGFFIATDWAQFSSMVLKKISNPGSSPSLSSNIQLTVPATMVPIDQAVWGSTLKISAFDDRLFAAMIMTNKLTGSASLWTAQNIEVNTLGVGTPGGGRNGSRWYEIGNLSTTPTLLQSGTLFDGSTIARGFWMPSIAMNGQGHALLGSSTAASDRRVQVAIAGRYYSDPAGTLEPYDTVTQTTSAYNPGGTTPYRWGDYSQTVIDPGNNMTFWTFQEYTDNTNNWGLRAIQVMAPPPAQSLSISAIPSNYCGVVVPLTITGLTTNNSGFFDAGSGYTRLTITCTGGITVSNVTFVSPTQLTCNINTAGIAAGNYTISVMNPDGQVVSSSFLLSGNCSPSGVINYYNAMNSDIKNLSNWWSNTDGATGNHPQDFITGHQVFNITHSGASLGSGLIISGSSSKVILGDGIIANTFTIPSTFSLTANIDVANLSTLNIANTTLPALGTLSATSTVAFTSASQQTIPPSTYGNLSVLGTGPDAIASGDIAVNSNLFVAASSSIDLGTFALIGASLLSGGSGTIKTQNLSATSIPTGKTWTPNIVYNASSTQNVIAGNYNNLDLTGGTRILANGGNISIAGILNAGSGIITVTGNTTTFNGNNQLIPGITFNNLTINTPGGASTLSGDVSINGALTMTAGKLSIAANTLVLGGTLVGMSAGNSLTGSATSNLSITGTGPLGILFMDQGTPGLSNSINNLTLNRTASGTATLGNQLNIITSYIPTTGVLNTGGFLLLRSSASGTARIAQGSSGGGYISGNVTVERYIPSNSNRAWRLLSIPTTTSNTINLAWQNGQVAGVSGPPGLGTFITSNNGNTSFDAQTPGNSMLTYSPVTNTYNGVPNTTSIIDNPTSGYFLYVRGDRSSVPSNSTITSTTLKTSGPLKEGTSAVTITPSGQYSLVGNPFPSEIDLTAVNRGSDIQDVFYVWDPKLAGINGVGAFQTLTKNTSTGTYDVTPGLGSYGSQYKWIESGQAFFIHSVGNVNNNFSFPETAKTSGNSNVLFNPTTIGEQLKTNLYSVGSPNLLLDGNLVQYDNSYSAIIDAIDAPKLSNFQINFGINRDVTLLAVEKRPIIGVTDSIFFNTSGLSPQQYQFEFNGINLNHPGLYGFLQDSYQPSLNTPINLNGITNIQFLVTTDPLTSAPDRFRVVFKPLSVLPISFLSLTAHSQNAQVLIKWSVAHEGNTQSYEVERSFNGSTFTTLASISAQNLSSFISYSWLDTDPFDGVNFYRVKSLNFDRSVSYSSIVKITMNSTKPLVSIYPDPVTSEKVTLELMNLPAGKYNLRLVNNIGQIVFIAQVDHQNGHTTHILNLGAIAKGNYHLSIFNPGSKTFDVKFTKL